MAISTNDLEILIQHRPQANGHVLSLYVDVGQSQAANLNRGFEAALKSMLRGIEQRLQPADKKAFSADAEPILEYVSAYTPRGRTMAAFSDSSTKFFWARDFNIPIPNDARWNETANLRPLIEAMDEYERYCVVIVNKEEARLFGVFLGEIEEHREVLSAVKAKHVKSNPRDRTLSQMQGQRRDGEQVLHHLKNVSEAVETLSATRRFDRFVLGGPTEVTRELEKLLPKRIQPLVVCCSSLAIDSTIQQVLKDTLRIEEEIERKGEARYVEDLVTTASKAGQAVLELQPTLLAQREGRIRKLVYVDRYAPNGAQCEKCNSLFPDHATVCNYCGAAVRPVEDLVERLAELVVDAGGQAENVRGAAADRLRQAGNIGAFLRF